MGLQYFRNRFYSPDIGRFISADPLGMVDGPNMYGFCGGDPVNRVDPMGTEWVWNNVTGQWDWRPEPGRPYPPKDHTGRVVRPAPLVRSPAGGYGHHPVPQAKTDQLLREGKITEDAARYLKYSPDCYQGWVPEADKHLGRGGVHDYGVAPGTNIKHSDYSNVVEQRFRDYIEGLPGKKAGVVEAQRFMEQIKFTCRRQPTDEVAIFCNAWERRKVEVAEQVCRIKKTLALRKIEEEAAAAARAARESRLRWKNLSPTTKVTVVTILISTVNSVTRKVVAEERSPTEAVKEMASETWQGVKAIPGQIASVPGEVVGTARDYQRAVTDSENERRREQAHQYNRNFHRGGFRPYAGIQAEANALFAPVEGAAKAVIDFGEAFRDEWLWWLP